MKTIAITGGKGGVGKTALSAAISMSIARSGRRTVLFDADLALANVDVTLGLDPQFGLQHVVSGERTLREILVEGPFGVRVACGGSGISSLMSAGPKRLSMFFAQLAGLEADTDALILDTGSGIDRRIMAFLKMADEVVVVVTPDPASLTDAYATIKQLHRVRPDASVHLVVNVALSEEEASMASSTLRGVVAQFLKIDVAELGWVGLDPVAARCIRSRTPLYERAPDSEMAKQVDRISAKILALNSVGSLQERYLATAG